MSHSSVQSGNGTLRNFSQHSSIPHLKKLHGSSPWVVWSRMPRMACTCYRCLRSLVAENTYRCIRFSRANSSLRIASMQDICCLILHTAVPIACYNTFLCYHFHFSCGIATKPNITSSDTGSAVQDNAFFVELVKKPGSIPMRYTTRSQVWASSCFLVSNKIRIRVSRTALSLIPLVSPHQNLRNRLPLLLARISSAGFHLPLSYHLFLPSPWLPLAILHVFLNWLFCRSVPTLQKTMSFLNVLVSSWVSCFPLLPGKVSQPRVTFLFIDGKVAFLLPARFQYHQFLMSGIGFMDVSVFLGPSFQIGTARVL